MPISQLCSRHLLALPQSNKEGLGQNICYIIDLLALVYYYLELLNYLHYATQSQILLDCRYLPHTVITAPATGTCNLQLLLSYLLYFKVINRQSIGKTVTMSPTCHHHSSDISTMKHSYHR